MYTAVVSLSACFVFLHWHSSSLTSFHAKLFWVLSGRGADNSYICIGNLCIGVIHHALLKILNAVKWRETTRTFSPRCSPCAKQTPVLNILWCVTNYNAMVSGGWWSGVLTDSDGGSPGKKKIRCSVRAVSTVYCSVELQTIAFHNHGVRRRPLPYD